MLHIYSLSALIVLDATTIYLLVTNLSVEVFILFILFLLLHTLYSAIFIRFLMFFFPIPEGRFSTSSPECYRWQAQALIYLSSAHYYDPFVPFMFRVPFYRFYGAKIGKGVAIGGKLLDISLTTLENHSGVGSDALVLSHLIANDEIILGRVVIEKNAMVGAKSLISPGVTLKEGATVGAMSLVTSGRTVPANETWVGQPAKKLEKTL